MPVSKSKVGALNLSPALRTLGCFALMIAGATGLVVSTGAHTSDMAVSAALPSLAAAWGTRADVVGSGAASPSKQMSGPTPVDFRSSIGHPQSKASTSMSGDEGFWLNTQTLAGSTKDALNVGDHMTIAGTTYVVTEFKPLFKDGSQHVVAGDKPTPGLTLVVAKEVLGPDLILANSITRKEPRLLRFLIDTLPATVKTDATETGRPHSTL